MSIFPADEIGPESLVFVSDPKSGMRGLLAIDCSALGPCGGGTRMMPDITWQEMAALARGMTYKFGILGFPRGGSKAGIWADPTMPPAQKNEHLWAFGRAIAPYLRNYDVAVGPDMGITVSDVEQIYAAAGVENRRTGLFERVLDGDPASYHLTGYGVVVAIEAAAAGMELPLRGATVAVEGFGQVGVGVARYAAALGAKVVAVSTIHGAVHDPEGLDVPWLLEARRRVGDQCVNEYEGGQKIPSGDIYFLPVDVLVPGARPYVITPSNVDRIQARLVVSGGNISITREADEMMFRRGINSVPDFVANSGGMIASLVDFHGGTPDQALNAIKKRIGPTTTTVMSTAAKQGVTPHAVATARVKESIREHRNKQRRPFSETIAQIKDMLEM